jgi:hypothetical protein
MTKFCCKKYVNDSLISRAAKLLKIRVPTCLAWRCVRPVAGMRLGWAPIVVMAQKKSKMCRAGTDPASN